MNVFAILAVVFCLAGKILALDGRLSDDCLNGVADKDDCCKGVPDAWYAHLRNPDDCGSFYQCEHEKATWKACPVGLEWSVTADQCDWPQSAQCKTGNIDGDDENPGNETNGEDLSTTTIAPPTTSAPPTKDQCAPGPVCHQCVTGVFPADLCCRDVKNYHKLNLANAKNCSSYYSCVNDHAILRQCPNGLHWSIETDRCEWPKNANCKVYDQGGNDGGNNGGSNGGSNGNDGQSSDCLHGNVNAATCCKNVPETIDVLLQNNADCHTYFQCVHGVPMVRPCPSNLWWSVTANRCEWKENATCTW